MLKSIDLSVENFITGMMNTVDQLIDHFVETGYHNLVSNYSGTISVMMTLYIAWLGYQFKTHSLAFDLKTLAKHLFLVVMVFSLIMNWNLFYRLIYNIFTNEPGYIMQAFVNIHGNWSTNSTAEALNTTFGEGMKATQLILSQASLSNFVWAYAILVWAGTFVCCLYALALIIYAKLAMAIVLALSPIFVSCLLWNSTKPLFESWLRALINYALYPIITCCILMLTLSLAQSTLPGLVSQVSTGTVKFTGIVPYLGCCVINGLILWQVHSQAAMLSGSVSLASINDSVGVMKAGFKASGGKWLYDKFKGRK